MTADHEHFLGAALDILFPDGPYFGGRTQGVQGPWHRHLQMSAAISLFGDLDRPFRMLEIGSWVGYSALTFAQSIDAFCPKGGTIVCVDPWLDYFSASDVAKGGTYREMSDLSRLGLSRALFDHNVRFAKPSVAVESRRGTSREILPGLATGSFDLVYIDGSHYRDDVLFDIDQGLRLLRDGGLLCGDDLELQADDCDRAFAQARLDQDTVIDPPSGLSFHPGVTFAVQERLGRVSNFYGFWVMRKAGPGVAPVELKGRPVIIPDHLPSDIRDQLVQASREMAAR